jgi:hypothetical protein
MLSRRTSKRWTVQASAPRLAMPVRLGVRQRSVRAEPIGEVIIDPGSDPMRGRAETSQRQPPPLSNLCGSRQRRSEFLNNLNDRHATGSGGDRHTSCCVIRRRDQHGHLTSVKSD